MKKLIYSYIITFALCFMLFLYEPIMMYANNINDFWFDLGIAFFPFLKLFLGIFIIGVLLLTLLYFLNSKLLKNKNIFSVLIIIEFICFLATYIQGNYLIKDLPILDGSAIAWSSFTKENIITLFVWLFIIILTIFCIKKVKLENTLKYASFLSLAVFAMLTTSLISTLMTTDALKSKDGINITNENLDTISNNDNFLIFLVDAIDSQTFNQILQDNEDYKKVFADFTYFPDTLSAYPFTRDSIPYILSGIWNKNEQEFSDYSSNALNNSPFFAELTNRNYQINLYDDELIWNGKGHDILQNISSIKNSNIDLTSFYKQELKYILFKYLPYNLKKYSRIEYMNFNMSIEKFRWNNDLIYENLKDNQTLRKVNKNQFQFVHAEGGHVPFDYDKDLNKIENGTYGQKVEASITLIKTYLERLKDNNSYDNSNIIIMADHGFAFDLIDPRFNPILLIKGKNEHHDLEISNLPISYEDLQSAYIDLLDNKKSDELFANIPEKRTRKLIWYIYGRENHMVEFETNDKAYESNKYKATGNIYDR